MNLKKLTTIAIIATSVCSAANAATTPARKLCVNGSSQVFARPKCLAAEKQLALPVATPTPTPTTTGLLNLNTCRSVSVTSPSVVGVATSSFLCDSSSEFLLNYGFTTSDGFNTDASVRSQEITYGTSGNLPAGISVTMAGSRSRNYNLNLTGTCCSAN